MAAIRAKNILKPFFVIILPEKYVDFANVFNKANADKLPPYNMHDLAIKTEKGKILLFGSVYD